MEESALHHNMKNHIIYWHPSSEHLKLCFRTTGAYFVFTTRQIKEQFEVHSKTQSPSLRDSDDSPPLRQTACFLSSIMTLKTKYL